MADTQFVNEVRAYLASQLESIKDVDAIEKTIIPKIKEVFQPGVDEALSKDQAFKDSEKARDFLRQKAKMYTTKTFGENSRILEKIYSRVNAESAKKAFDFKINVLNVPGTPDLLSFFALERQGMMTRSGPDTQAVKFSSLVNYANFVGVKHIILFDFSCATMDVDDRTTRAYRRAILQEGLGRKTRRSKKKTESRRGRKRTLHKWRR